MNKFILGLTLFSLILLNSCVSKKIVYVQDMIPDTEYPVAEAPAIRLQKNDRLSIQVSAKSLELAAPFNTVAGTYKVGNDGSVSTGIDQSSNAQGYLIDREGNIAFPVLGNLHVEGLTLEEVRDLIRNRLINDRLINEPIVKVEILNFKVSITGAIGNRVIDVPDGKMTLLEAITKAGGININAAPDKITVIREEDGMRRKIVTNIQSQEIFNSPAYYLRQNDIVYIEPRTTEVTPREDRFWRYFGTGMGLIGTVISVLTLIKVTK
ncbi:sugar transporter [Elizabethkingia sp. HvH-WGS333]|uniref:polysaccharide biosynthesis/export family protein n=1 Tax=Elizabethkingia TaxID=308865 RepID=UPI0007420ADE|nr:MULTISPECIES: polysaccharide biosynthesis/export family protein [Elizabethkingia]KUG10422.1 sugar transporter [Elizabethkingia miricola]MCL1655360.1 polysaccharide biosynthesis/export family protein [Elizabethkingia miricola]MCP1252918.1 polysaccharide biosynthesis/export family protein [Elizabethkingia sp. S0634]MDX8573115.1 polysaccharide biosynthesis/export family protein [Elizabethkingia sp. HX QKY]OIK45761.1 sugar transporter [Elizabethkingia sp. HvH-WGS333]